MQHAWGPTRAVHNAYGQVWAGIFRDNYAREFPVRLHEIMDTRRWGPGERIVFEPYSAEIFSQSRGWIARLVSSSTGRWPRRTTSPGTRRP